LHWFFQKVESYKKPGRVEKYHLLSGALILDGLTNRRSLAAHVRAERAQRFVYRPAPRGDLWRGEFTLRSLPESSLIFS